MSAARSSVKETNLGCWSWDPWGAEEGRLVGWSCCPCWPPPTLLLPPIHLLFICAMLRFVSCTKRAATSCSSPSCPTPHSPPPHLTVLTPRLLRQRNFPLSTSSCRGTPISSSSLLCRQSCSSSKRRHMQEADERPNKAWDGFSLALWSGSWEVGVRRIGELTVVKWEEGGVGGSLVNHAALPGAATRKSGKGRAGTGPNDSSTTALYKYSRVESTRLLMLLPVATAGGSLWPCSISWRIEWLLVTGHSHCDWFWRLRWRWNWKTESVDGLSGGRGSAGCGCDGALGVGQSEDVQIFTQTQISLHTSGLNLQVKCPQETNIRVQESREAPTAQGNIPPAERHMW